MCQRKYTLELIFELGLGGAKVAGTLLELNQKLTSEQNDKYIKGDMEALDEPLKDPGGYQSLVGKLLYLTI